MPPYSCDAPGGRHRLTMSHSPASSSPPLPQRLPEDVWTSARPDVTHPEPSGLSWSRARVYFPFYIISWMFEWVSAAETAFRLFSIQQRVPKQPLLYLAWDANTKYVMIQHHVPASIWMNHYHNLSKIQNNIQFINSLIQVISIQLWLWREHGDLCCVSKQYMIQFKLNQFIRSLADLNIRKSF